MTDLQAIVMWRVRQWIPYADSLIFDLLFSPLTSTDTVMKESVRSRGEIESGTEALQDLLAQPSSSRDLDFINVAASRRRLKLSTSPLGVGL